MFGGGLGQPETNHELYELCQDVIDIAKEYSVQLIYTLGAFHTNRDYQKSPINAHYKHFARVDKPGFRPRA